MNLKLTDDQFQKALSAEDEIGSVIRTHLYIENLVNQLLHELTPFPDDLKPLGLDYDGKVNLICALGIKPQHTKVLKVLGNLRNKFAHDLDFKLDKSAVNNLYDALSSEEKQSLQTAHDLTRSKPEHSTIGKFNSLDSKSQFVMISVVVREMVGNLLYEAKNR